MPIRSIATAIGGALGVAAVQAWKGQYTGGNLWAGWPAWGEFFRVACGVAVDLAKWGPWQHLAEHSAIRYTHRDFVVISDFPTALRLDSSGRPHCATGPYLEWADGSCCYAWHGIRTPAWIIDSPELITVEKIDAEANAEIRRVMLDRFGFAKYLEIKQATLIDCADDEGGQPMRLLSMSGQDREMRCLHLRNSTVDPDGSSREYVVPVPVECQTAWAARNWTFGLDAAARFDAVS